MGLYRGAAQDPFAATARLREAGIPGIRYLDQGSRGGGAGTSNYVLFRDDIIDILKKYGIAGGVGGGLAGSSGGEPGNRLDLPHMQYGGVIKAAEPLAARVLRYLGTEAGPEALAIARQYLREPQRVANPGIYKDPRRLAAEAEARVAPEDPAMKQLFGVTRQDLYDISRGGTRPGNLPEMVLPPAVGARGENYAAQRLMTPENAQRQLDAIAEARRSAPGLTQGMVPWYVMDPAYEATERASSKAAAPDLFRRFTGFTGLSSPASPVEWELQRGTAANMMSRLGRWGDWEKYGGMPAEQRPPDIAALLGTTPGHLTHSSVQTPKGRIMHETGQWPQFEDPKVQLYIPSGSAPQIGFQTQWPVPDVHFSGAAGLADVLETATKPKRAMKMGEYKSFAPWWRSTVADPSGMQSTSTQGLQWGLYSPQTGVKTTIGAPKLELFSKEIMRRANELGITPEEVRDKVLRGEERVELPQTAGYA